MQYLNAVHAIPHIDKNRRTIASLLLICSRSVPKKWCTFENDVIRIGKEI